jgi:hypothetical protein
MSHEASHESLEQELQKLRLQQFADAQLASPSHPNHSATQSDEIPENAEHGEANAYTPSPKSHGGFALLKEGYGFKRSGIATPVTGVADKQNLPDPNGLGWPGMLTLDGKPSSFLWSL